MKVNSQIPIEAATGLVLPANIDADGKPQLFVRNSYLSMVKRALMCTGSMGPQWGNQRFLKFGNELHKRVLEPHLPKDLLLPEEEAMMANMLETLLSDKQFSKTLKITRHETTLYTVIDGILIRGTLDMDIPFKLIDDLKTTSTATEKAFIDASRKYDYPRQAWIYGKMNGSDPAYFNFTGIQKEAVKPAKLFRMPMGDFPQLLKEGEEQARYLINIYKKKQGDYASNYFQIYQDNRAAA